MHRTHALGLCLALAATLLVATACEAVGPDGSLAAGGDDEAFAYASYALEEDDGGFDEAAAIDLFEDVDGEDMRAWFEANDEEDVADDASLDPPTPAIPDGAPDGAPPVSVYHVRVLWGQPFPNPFAAAPVDWSGAITTDAGLLKIRRLLRFERRAGDGVAPRTDPQTITIRSATLPHNDGLLLSLVLPERPEGAEAPDVAVPPPADFPPPAATGPQLRIDLGAVSLAYPIAALDGLSDVQVVDEAGNVVAVHATRADRPEACARGPVAGYWKRLNRRGGVFGGRWIAADGETVGRVAGIWGRRLNGRRALFGFVRGEDGAFLGLLRGTYTPRGERPHPEPGLPDDDATAPGHEPPAMDGERPEMDGERPEMDGERPEMDGERPEMDGGDGPALAGTFAARWVGRDRLHRGVVRGHFAGDGEGRGAFRGGWAKACVEDPSAGLPDTPRGCDDGEDCPSFMDGERPHGGGPEGDRPDAPEGDHPDA